MSILERLQSDAREALKARDRERVSTLRMLADALAQDAKLGDGDEVAVLRRERKKRLDAAQAFRDGGNEERAAAEEAEAELASAYLPAELSDEELESMVAEAVAESGAESPKDMGRVMSAVMPRVAGRADGRRVSTAVRERLGA
jgi:uncharacterized protein YqeY